MQQTTTAPTQREAEGRAGLTAAIVIAAVTVFVAVAGSLGTDPDSSWFTALDKPSFYPPNWLFGPVWTAIYVLAAASAWLAWRDVAGEQRSSVMWMFAGNAALNLAWTFIFFRAQAPVVAGIEIVVLLASIVWLIVRIRPWNTTAAALLVPYALWVTFATALTWAIAIAN